MDETKEKILKASLLHDVGKIVFRAKSVRVKHSQLGKEWLENYCKDEDILRAVAHHHQDELKQAQLEAEDISYIVYEADNLSSGADRRMEEGESGQSFQSLLNLSSVFNAFESLSPKEDRTAFYLEKAQEENVSYPRMSSGMSASPEGYQKILQDLEVNFRQKNLDAMSVNELLMLTEVLMKYVPSSTNTKELPDVSLHDHQRLTAAFATCLYDFFLEKGEKNYKKACMSSAAKWRKEELYLLVKGKLYGVEDFIGNVPSKGALKSLRGRMFYMDILLNHIADEILESADLTRANVVFIGKSDFCLLLPNTSKVEGVLDKIKRLFNDWFLENFGNQLYFSLARIKASGNMLVKNKDNDGNIGTLLHGLEKELFRKRNRRYTEEQLSFLLDETSSLNVRAEEGRECAACHTSSKHLHVGEFTGTMVCDACENLYHLGKKSLDGDLIAFYQQQVSRECLPVPSLRENLYIDILPSERAASEESFAKIYQKNRFVIGNKLCRQIFMSDYVARDEGGNVHELESLAEQSGDVASGIGIKRLGVLYLNADHLTAAFWAGFQEQYMTFSRMATLSGAVEDFFRRNLRFLCEGKINGVREKGHKAFRLFSAEEAGNRMVHVVYSGGGEAFLVGAWDAVTELSIDIEKSYRRFTNGKLTISAGLAFFGAKTPVAEMERYTRYLCAHAKRQGRDRIALSGIVMEQDDEQISCYPWQRLEEKVFGEKLSFLQKNFSVGEASVSKLSIGKGLLYRMLYLMRDATQGIHLARFAYLLARLEPAEKEKMPCYDAVRNKMYQWYRSPVDRQELMTAIEFLVYQLREKGE